MSAPAPAPRFAPHPHRRALIAKVHVAKKELRLSDDDYQSVLLSVVGHMSAADCSDAELSRLVDHFKAKGFKPKQAKGRAAKTRPADHPSARKARAMWISLYQLGAIDHPGENALEAFAKRQLGVDALQWANQAQCYKLVEALKAMAERHGWHQRVDHVSGVHVFHALKVRLVDAIVAKLKAAGIAHRDWNVSQTAFRLCGIGDGVSVLFETSELEQMARSLGEKLRAHGRLA